MKTKNLVKTTAQRTAFNILFWTFICTRIPGMLSAQGCVMTCPPMSPPVGISIGADCIDTLTLGLLGVTTSGCQGPYTIDAMYNGMSLGDIITGDLIGDTLMVIVTSETEQQSCMMTITVQDKTPPQFNCPGNIVVPCNADLDSIPVSTSEDATDCSDVNVTFYDDLIYSGNCNSDYISKVTRTYFAIDDYGNAVSCTQMIFFVPLSLEDVVFPPNYVANEALACSPPPDTSPAATGIPEINGFPIVNGQVCNISVTHSDVTTSLCSGGYKIFRTWVVIDWCAGNTSIDSVQIIEVADLTPPEVNAPDTILASAGAGCVADVVLPPAEVLEDCSGSYDVRMQGDFGTIHSNGGPIGDLGLGAHMVIYIATNECNHEGRDTTIVLVVDDTPPNPVCKASVAIPLGNDGMAIVNASAFDAGSSDNCGQVYFKARRMDTPQGFTCYADDNSQYQFDDVIKFCCEDIGNNNLMVILRVYDLPPVPGPVSDDYLMGHFAQCMLQVQVQDKRPPEIICPSDLTVSCMFAYDPNDLSMFGSVVTNPADREQICLDDIGNPHTFGLTCIGLDGLATDNCSVSVYDTSFFDLTMCGTGTIHRRFTATDPGGLVASCEQVITIINYEPFTIDDISWPPDYTTYDVCEIDLLDPVDLPPPYNEPGITEDQCDLVGFTYEDIVFDFSNSSQACFKILRTWSVIDWCQYQVGGSAGLWMHTQIIKVMNNIPPELSLTTQDTTICTDDALCGPGHVLLAASATDDCSASDALTWSIKVDRDNNGSLDQVFGPFSGASVGQTVLLPLGTHRVLYSVEDRCGNLTTEEQFITVVSCKPPTAKCQNLTVSLMPVGMVTLWASDLDAGSSHPCGNPVTVAFSDDTTDVSRVFNCSNLGESQVELWVIDNNGNTDHCTVTVTVQDNFGTCDPDPQPYATISGTISTALTESVSGVQVQLLGSNLGSQSTDDSGNYTFPPMPYGGSYSVMPGLNTDARKGVTTLDLILLQKHLLGIHELDNPYTMIAADANHSGTISAMDIVVLRKLILGITDTIQNNTSWRFVDAAYQFDSPANPFAEDFSESYHISTLAGNMQHVDFVAIKVGDLNGSAMGDLQNNSVSQRNTPSEIPMYLQDHAFDRGESAIMTLYCDKLTSLEGMQFTLSWDPELLDIVPLNNEGVDLSESNWNAGLLDRGKLPVSWTRLDAQGNPIVRQVVKFRITGKSRVALSEAGLRIDSSITQEEAELTDGTPVQVHLDILPLTSGAHGLLVYQNRPNPFTHKSIIPVVLPEATQVSLQVYQTDGKLVYQDKIDGRKGYNEFMVDAYALGGNGVYTYRVSTTSEYRTLRMIVVDE